jgi:hypothetical protein
MTDPIAIAAAAQILGLSTSRVRAMAVKGQLGALKIGGRWVVERAAVEARRRNGAVSGRPFAPHNAWALLLLASGKDVEGIDPSVRSRLRRALAVDGLVELAPRLALRSEARLFSAHPGEVAHLLRDPVLVKTGISAAGELGIDLLSAREADGYLSADELKEFVGHHALTTPEGSVPNVRVRLVPEKAWCFLEGVSTAPLAAVALDLSEDPDPRSSRAGKAALRELDSRLATRHPTRRQAQA